MEREGSPCKAGGGFYSLSADPQTVPWLLLPFWTGGDPGSPGLNLLIQAHGRTMNLGAKMSVKVQPGVRSPWSASLLGCPVLEAALLRGLSLSLARRTSSACRPQGEGALDGALNRQACPKGLKRPGSGHSSSGNEAASTTTAGHRRELMGPEEGEGEEGPRLSRADLARKDRMERLEEKVAGQFHLSPQGGSRDWLSSFPGPMGGRVK